MSDSDSGSTVVFDRAYLRDAYEEAIALVEETASYLSHEGEEVKETLGPVAMGTFMSESMRLTTRLTQMMSWLMLQRALYNGEITLEEARKPEHRLQQSASKYAPDEAARHVLPEALTSLIVRTDHLYHRVERLEEQLHETGDENAVQAMLDQIESEMKKP